MSYFLGRNNTTQHPHSGRSLVCPLTNPETALWLSTRAPIKTKAPTPSGPFFLPYKLSLTSSSLLQLSFFLSPFYKQQPTLSPPSFFPRVLGLLELSGLVLPS